MQTTTYARTPSFVEAVQITAENLGEVARWCKGEIRGGPDPINQYIKVSVYRPVTDRQSKAFVGDWVLRERNSFKVYTVQAFAKCYVDPSKLEPEEDVQIEWSTPIFDEVVRVIQEALDIRTNAVQKGIPLFEHAALATADQVVTTMQIGSHRHVFEKPASLEGEEPVRFADLVRTEGVGALTVERRHD